MQRVHRQCDRGAGSLWFSPSAALGLLAEPVIDAEVLKHAPGRGHLCFWVPELSQLKGWQPMGVGSAQHFGESGPWSPKLGTQIKGGLLESESFRPKGTTSSSSLTLTSSMS